MITIDVVAAVQTLGQRLRHDKLVNGGNLVDICAHYKHGVMRVMHTGSSDHHHDQGAFRVYAVQLVKSKETRNNALKPTCTPASGKPKDSDERPA